MSITHVISIKNEPYDIYIGRGSDWGNPYAIGIDGDRDEVIRKYQYDFERGFLKNSKEQLLKNLRLSLQTCRLSRGYFSQLFKFTR